MIEWFWVEVNRLTLAFCLYLSKNDCLIFLQFTIVTGFPIL